MEISRNPIPPKLNKKAIKLLTDLCFRSDDELKEVDGIFVFSTIIGVDRLASKIKEILLKNISNNIFITGGITPQQSAEELGVNTDVTESDVLLRVLNLEKYKDLNIFVERKSTNTLENVTETLKNSEFKNCKSILFIFKSHAAGRGYLTLRKFFPKAKILQQTFNTKYTDAEKEINRNNWYTFQFGRERVWGEFLRIKTYGTRGDISFEEVSDLVKEIEGELG